MSCIAEMKPGRLRGWAERSLCHQVSIVLLRSLDRVHTQATELCTQQLEPSHNLPNSCRRPVAIGNQWLQQRVEKGASSIGCSMKTNFVDRHGHGRLVHHLNATQQSFRGRRVTKEYHLGDPSLLRGIFAVLEVRIGSGFLLKGAWVGAKSRERIQALRDVLAGESD